MSRTTTINLLLLIVGLALLWLLTWPLLGRTQELKATAKLKVAEIAAEREAVARLAELENKVESRKDALERLELALPAGRDIAAAVAIFEEMANVNGLVLRNVQLSEPAATKTGSKPMVEVLNVQLKLEGRYLALQNFLEDIETTFPLMDVVNISFLVPPKAGSSEEEEDKFINPLLEITITLETYHRGP